MQHPHAVLIMCWVSQNGVSAIHWASRNGHDKVVRVLSHAGADINTQYKVIHN